MTKLKSCVKLKYTQTYIIITGVVNRWKGYEARKNQTNMPRFLLEGPRPSTEPTYNMNFFHQNQIRLASNLPNNSEKKDAIKNLRIVANDLTFQINVG